MNIIGILLAIGALLGWGIGDFLIQKTARKTDIWKTMFYIGFVATIGLLPFIFKDLKQISFGSTNLIILLIASVVAFFTFTFDAEALKDGKITVIEPIIGLEAPITVGLSVVIIGDRLSLLQLLLMFIIFIGSILTVTINHQHLHYHKRLLEKGVIFAIIGAFGMGLTDFLIGISSQDTSPLLAVWSTNFVLLILCLIKFITNKELKEALSEFIKNPVLILFTSIIDNLAWISYASSVTIIPISIAIFISESYIVLTGILGYFFNKEKLQKHQIIGISIATLGIILLSSIFQ